MKRLGLWVLLLLAGLAACNKTVDNGPQAPLPEELLALPRPLPFWEKRTGLNVDPLDLVREAREEIARVEDKEQAVQLLAELTGRLNRINRPAEGREALAQAFAAAEVIEHPYARAVLKRSLVTHAVELGDVEEALEILKLPLGGPDIVRKDIPGGALATRPPEKIKHLLLFQAVLDQLVEVGEMDRALELLKTSPSAPPSESVRTDFLALAMARAGDGLGGLALLMKKPRPKANLLRLQAPMEFASLAEAQAVSGNFAGAVETAREFPEEIERLKGLQRVARRQIRQHDPIGAVEMVRREVQPFPVKVYEETIGGASPEQYANATVVHTYRDAIEELASRGFPEEARRLLESAEIFLPPQSRVIALSVVATAYLRRGEATKAEAALDEAEEVLPVVGENMRQNTLRWIGWANARYGRLDKAREQLGAEDGDPDWRKINIAFAVGKRRSGDERTYGEAIARTLEMSAGRERLQERIKDLRKLILELLLDGEIDEAVQWARSEPDHAVRASLLLWAGTKILEFWPL